MYFVFYSLFYLTLNIFQTSSGIDLGDGAVLSHILSSSFMGVSFRS